MIREGQMVGWICAPKGKKRELLVCLVRRFDGVDDHLVELVTEKCLLSGGPSRYDSMAHTFHTHLIPVDWANRYGDIIVPKERADEIEKKILAFLQTKQGKAMVARPSRKKPEAPESGRGQLQRSDLPLKLSKGFSSSLSYAFEQRLDNGGMRSWTLAQMGRENPVMANVFEDREKHGYSFYEIGERRNLTEGNARLIYFRGKIAFREISLSYPVVMRREAREADAA